MGEVWIPREVEVWILDEMYLKTAPISSEISPAARGRTVAVVEEWAVLLSERLPSQEIGSL